MRAREQIAHSRWHSINFFRVLLLGSLTCASVSLVNIIILPGRLSSQTSLLSRSFVRTINSKLQSPVCALQNSQKKISHQLMNFNFFSLLFPACLPIKMQQPRARVLCRVARSHTGNVITVLDAKLDHKNGNSPRLFFFFAPSSAWKQFIMFSSFAMEKKSRRAAKHQTARLMA